MQSLDKRSCDTPIQANNHERILSKRVLMHSPSISGNVVPACVGVSLWLCPGYAVADCPGCQSVVAGTGTGLDGFRHRMEDPAEDLAPGSQAHEAAGFRACSIRCGWTSMGRRKSQSTCGRRWRRARPPRAVRRALTTCTR